MQEFFNEIDVWETLKHSEIPNILYGMGDGADKIINVMEEKDIAISGIFASDDFVRGQVFHGFKVKKYSDICSEFKNFNVVLCFGSNRDEVINIISKINGEHNVFAPDVPIAGNGLFTSKFVENNIDSFTKVYEQLADDKSKQFYSNIVKFKISGKISYLLEEFTTLEEVYSILNLSYNETIADLGAYDGDTINHYLDYASDTYKHIDAFEPDKKNFKKLEKNANFLSNITLFNEAVGENVGSILFNSTSSRNSKASSQGIPIPQTCIDSQKKSYTYIKMDIEGAELRAIEGAKDTIKANHPKLYICAYHRNEDLFSIPLKILEIDPTYKIYFRHTKYIPAWESNFYFI